MIIMTFGVVYSFISDDEVTHQSSTVVGLYTVKVKNRVQLVVQIRRSWLLTLQL